MRQSPHGPIHSNLDAGTDADARPQKCNEPRYPTLKIHRLALPLLYNLAVLATPFIESSRPEAFMPASLCIRVLLGLPYALTAPRLSPRAFMTSSTPVAGEYLLERCL